jgi:rhodanese-related sulfurtransferase
MKTKTIFGLLTLLISSLFLVSCSSGGSSAITNVDATAFLAKAQSENVQVIDVRTYGEFESGHLKGALNIDVESGAFDSGITNLDKTATYALYCRSGRRSTIAAERMADAGFTNIINFNVGGFDQLVAAGAEVE